MEKQNISYFKKSKQEHLEKEFSPIRVCISDTDSLTEETLKNINNIKTNGELVKMGNLSGLNETSKYSLEYQYCTGIIMVGVDKETGKQISFMTHQSPFHIAEDSFKKILIESINELNQRSKSGSIDAVIFGSRSDSLNDTSIYKNSIINLNEICKNQLGFEPIILTGPNISTVNKISDRCTDIYFDTESRRLDLVRPKQVNDKLNESFNASEYSEQEKEWIKNQ